MGFSRFCGQHDVPLYKRVWAEGGHLLKPLRDALGKRSRRAKTGVKSGGRDPVSEKVNPKNSDFFHFKKKEKLNFIQNHDHTQKMMQKMFQK